MNLHVISKVSLSLAIAGILFVSHVLAWKPGFVPPPEQLKKLEKINAKRRYEKNTTVLMYGKVEDFDGCPVSDAKVAVRLSTVPKSVLKNDQRLLHAVTDSNGQFEVEGDGFKLYIAEIEKEGYQFKAGFSEKQSLDFKKGKKHTGTGYEPDKPMVFKVRKKGPPAFIMGGGGRLRISPDDVILMDMYGRSLTPPNELITHKMSYSDWHADLKISVEKDGTGYRLIFEALDQDSGFAKVTPRFKDELVEAPHNGYKPKMVIPVKEGESGHFYAYVKNEGGLFYSMINTSYSHREGADHVGLESYYSTNMTGGRGFEYDIDFNQEYRRIRKEKKLPPLTRENFRNGKIDPPALEVSQ